MTALLANRYVVMGAILLLWGLWGFFPKVAAGHLDARSSSVYQTIGGIAVTLAILWSMGFKVATHGPSIFVLLLGGAAASLGGLLLMHLLKTETATIAVSVTALYPMVTVLLAVIFLGETVNLRQGVGILFSLIGLVLLAA
jgi:transporter family protein